MGTGLCRFGRKMKTIFGLEGCAPFSFRRGLWLCLPAVVIGAVKPAGRPLWLGLLLAAMLSTGNPLA